MWNCSEPRSFCQASFLWNMFLRSFLPCYSCLHVIYRHFPTLKLIKIFVLLHSKSDLIRTVRVVVAWWTINCTTFWPPIIGLKIYLLLLGCQGPLRVTLISKFLIKAFTLLASHLMPSSHSVLKVVVCCSV